MTALDERPELVPEGSGRAGGRTAAAAPPDRGDRRLRIAVLTAALVCATCGLVYELSLVALGSYLLGDAVTQASIVLSTMVFAMGVGALVAKPLARRPAPAFAVVEGLLALLGGLSVLGLYASFAWLEVYRPVLIVTSLLLGALIGAEIPLLVALLERLRRPSGTNGSSRLVADVFAADYLGALVGGLAFPFLLLPFFGQVKGALVVGVVNAAAGAAVLLVFRRGVGRPARWACTAGFLLVVAVLVGTYRWVDDFEIDARQALYRDPVVEAATTPYQSIVVTKARDDLRMYLDGDLQFSTRDEYRYHESLVHPVMRPEVQSVLVLGGGDGLALREVLRYPHVRSVTLVELDPAVVTLARTRPEIVQANAASFADPRVQVVHADAFTWLRDTVRSADGRGRYDAVVADMPDPDAPALAKLYSVEYYGLVARTMAPGALLSVQAGSPYFATAPFWCIEASVQAAGLVTTPYHVDVPSFGDWGFVLAGRTRPEPRLSPAAPPMRFLTPEVLQAATVFPADRRPRDAEPSTLMHPVIVELSRHAWRGY